MSAQGIEPFAHELPKIVIGASPDGFLCVGHDNNHSFTTIKGGAKVNGRWYRTCDLRRDSKGFLYVSVENLIRKNKERSEGFARNDFDADSWAKIKH